MATFAPRFTCRETAASLTSRNPIPYDGEICCESDTGKIKIGDGRTAWNDLSYAGDGTGTSPTVNTVATNVSYDALTTVSDFTFAAEANATYIVQGVILVTQDAQAGILFDVDGPSGFTASGSAIAASSSGAEITTFNQSGDVFGMATGVGGDANAVPLLFNAIVKTSSTAGNVSFDIQKDGGGGTNLVLAGSSIVITQS